MTCSGCGKQSQGLQQDLFAPSQELCVQCLTNARAEMILHTLPDPDDWEHERLSKWEQGFLASVRQQFAKNKTVSEKQYQTLEKIWEKMNA